MIHLIASASLSGLFFDPCEFLFSSNGPCTTAESLIMKAISYGCFYVSVLYGSLTYIQNKENTSKLKCLELMGTFSAITLLLANSLVPTSYSGEKKWIHFADTITLWILVVIMMTAIFKDLQASNLTGNFQITLGTNPKTFVLFVSIALFAKTIALSEGFISPSYVIEVLGEDNTFDITDGVSALWVWMTVFCIEILFAFIFTLGFASEKAQESVTVIVSSMIIIGAAIFPIFNSSLNKVQICIPLVALPLIGFLCAIRGRTMVNVDGYEQVV